jgi:Domain of unknown function (DUF6895)
LDVATTTLRVALQWFSRHEDEISHLARNASQDATHQQEVHKTLSELLIVFDQLTRLEEQKCSGVRRLIDTIASSIDPTFYAESIVRFPNRFRLYGAICGVLARHTRSDILFQNGLAVAQMGTDSVESSLMRRLDAHFVAKEYFSVGEPCREMRAAARQFLCARPGPHLLTNDYLYAFTHIVFYLTQLGRDPALIEDLKAAGIRSLIRLYTSLCAASGDNDLLAEFILCSIFLDAGPTEASILSLAEAQIADGSIPRYSTRPTPAIEGSFADSYHTTLVASWALAEFAASSRQSRCAVADDAPDESLSTPIIADDMRSTVYANLVSNLTNRNLSLLQNLAFEDLAGDFAMTFRLAELATRAGPRLDRQLLALLNKCGRAPMSEVVRAADSLARLPQSNGSVAGLRAGYIGVLKLGLSRQEPLHPIHVLRLWNEGRCPRLALADAIHASEGQLGALEAVWQLLRSHVAREKGAGLTVASEIAKTLYVHVYRRNLPATLEIIEILFNLRGGGELVQSLQRPIWTILFPLAIELISHSSMTSNAPADAKQKLESEVNCLVLAGRIIDGLSIAVPAKAQHFGTRVKSTSAL